MGSLLWQFFKPNSLKSVLLHLDKTPTGNGIGFEKRYSVSKIVQEKTISFERKFREKLEESQRTSFEKSTRVLMGFILNNQQIVVIQVRTQKWL